MCLHIVLGQKHSSQAIPLLIKVIRIFRYSKQKINYRAYTENDAFGGIHLYVHIILEE